VVHIYQMIATGPLVNGVHSLQLCKLTAVSSLSLGAPGDSDTLSHNFPTLMHTICS